MKRFVSLNSRVVQLGIVEDSWCRRGGMDDGSKFMAPGA